ncbi:MAG: CDP-alcohol phosphatidyltransferase family protein [Blautia sp.]|jgi:cardiolipin synthase
MRKETKREYFSIPNLMGYFRILLIPIYLYVYIHAESTADYYAAAGIMVLSYLSDFLDGKIARRFHMITEFGKILDPVADKLTQGALALSFAFRYPALKVFFVAFLCKELMMGLLGAYMMKKGRRMNGAQWHGKICTAVIDLMMFLLLILPSLSHNVVLILVSISLIVMVFSFLSYLRLYMEMWKQTPKEQA